MRPPPTSDVVLISSGSSLPWTFSFGPAASAIISLASPSAEPPSRGFGEGEPFGSEFSADERTPPAANQKVTPRFTKPPNEKAYGLERKTESMSQPKTYPPREPFTNFL